MAYNMRYSVFKTRWGWFGLLANDNGLLRACLPLTDKGAVRASLLADIDIPDIPSAVKTMGKCQERIQAYFDGQRVEFADVPVDLSGFGAFEQKILQTLSGIRYGETLSYAGLAGRSGRPGAIRAAANAVGKNPLPLIIPCHRVVRKDGSPGGFSAPGGIATKKRLLEREHVYF